MAYVPVCDDCCGLITSRRPRADSSSPTAPWGGEIIVFPWEDGLAMLDLPSTQPMADLIRLRAVPGSPGRFRRLRENDVLGEPIDFGMNADGRVTHLRRWNNPFPKMTDR